MDFCHLHIHNEYSVLDGLGTAEEYATAAEAMGMKYLCLTNHGNIDGVLQWQEACEKHGVAPVVGCEMYVVDDARVKEKGEKRNHVTLLVKDQKGFRNLNKMLTHACLEGFYYRPRIDWPLLLSHLEGLVLLTGCVDSVLQEAKKGSKILEALAAAAADDLYFEVMPHILSKQKVLNKKIEKYHSKYRNKIVATNDCHYVRSADYKLQEVLLAIQSKKTWGDPGRFRFEVQNLHLRSSQEMISAFHRQNILPGEIVRQALKNTIEVAEKCSGFRIKKKKIRLPEVSLPDGVEEDEMLWQMCQDGLKKKRGASGLPLSKSEKKIYSRRVEEEIKLIVRKDFVRYFLIVEDLVRWCRKNNIMVGPGRGSVGGSLVADLIGITTGVDPIKYDLLFDRFIAEDRVDYPDIDLDFEDNRREQARNYLELKYGVGRVVGITTALRMKTKNALRDVARVFEVPMVEVNEVCNAVGTLGYRAGNEGFDIVDAALSKAQNVDSTVDIVKRFNRRHEQVVNYARALDGQVRAHGQHAAAVVLSPVDLNSGSRGHLLERKNNLLINWDMKDAEKLGLLKIDLLGLNTLTVLNETKRLAKESRGIEIDFSKIDMEDKALFDMINVGATTALFQVQTEFTSGICGQIVIEKFSHLCDAIALARPGPYDSGMTANYIRRKHGEGWRRMGKHYEEITAETFGVIVYQEQVMAVVRRLAGLSYSDADKIRRIIGKKRDKKYFEQYKKEFVRGCLKKETMSKREALVFWDGLEKHARYSFNKSHSVEYAMITMWTAYCKHYHPTEFISAALTYMGDKPEQKKALLDEGKRLGLVVMLPKVGESSAVRWVSKGMKLYMPFVEIKGIGLKTALKIAADGDIVAEKKGADISGFFKVSKPPTKKKESTKVEKLLVAVGAYSDNEEVPEGAGEFFDFDVVGNFDKRNPRLMELYGGDIFPTDQQAALTAHFYKKGVIVKAAYEGDKVKSCKNCALRAEAKLPVPSDAGRYNIAIVLEAPGRMEDKRGKPAVGKAGNALWSELRKYGLHRSMFHVTNVNKCYPSRTRTPTVAQVLACRQWLNRELKEIDCRLVLACGNNPLFFFTGQQGGIRKLSGEIVWNDSRGLWTVFAVHPSSVLRARSQNLEYFEKGVKVFADAVNRFVKKRRRQKNEQKSKSRGS